MCRGTQEGGLGWSVNAFHQKCAKKHVFKKVARMKKVRIVVGWFVRRLFRGCTLKSKLRQTHKCLFFVVLCKKIAQIRPSRSMLAVSSEEGIADSSKGYHHFKMVVSGVGVTDGAFEGSCCCDRTACVTSCISCCFCFCYCAIALVLAAIAGFKYIYAYCVPMAMLAYALGLRQVSFRAPTLESRIDRTLRLHL